MIVILGLVCLLATFGYIGWVPEKKQNVPSKTLENNFYPRCHRRHY
jgi:hypothetical protein